MNNIMTDTSDNTMAVDNFIRKVQGKNFDGEPNAVVSLNLNRVYKCDGEVYSDEMSSVDILSAEVSFDFTDEFCNIKLSFPSKFDRSLIESWTLIKEMKDAIADFCSLRLPEEELLLKGVPTFLLTIVPNEEPSPYEEYLYSASAVNPINVYLSVDDIKSEEINVLGFTFKLSDINLNALPKTELNFDEEIAAAENEIMSQVMLDEEEDAREAERNALKEQYYGNRR